MSQEHIDELLVRYLGLLDEYTALRQELSKVQASVYQNIARANFSAERGLRYGQDHYDERMQATRRLELTVDEAGGSVFKISDTTAVEKTTQDDGDSEDKEKEEKPEGDKPDKAKATKHRNPLHWFGLFAPMPLRNAQSQSIDVVERVIPRLLSVNAEMQSLEIEVGRARKRRAKADAAQKKGAVSEAQDTSTAVEAS